MKLTYPKWADVTPATIKLEGEPSADGAPVVALEWSGLVNFSEKAKSIQDKDGRWVRLSGVVRVEGDILGDVPFIRGTCTVGSLTSRSIVSISRPRNPDGTINHTRLELI